MKKPLTYISLFSSAGVGCYGFKLNGFECIATNELLTKRLKIQAFNNKCKYDSGLLQMSCPQAFAGLAWADGWLARGVHLPGSPFQT